MKLVIVIVSNKDLTNVLSSTVKKDIFQQDFNSGNVS